MMKTEGRRDMEKSGKVEAKNKREELDMYIGGMSIHEKTKRFSWNFQIKYKKGGRKIECILT